MTYIPNEKRYETMTYVRSGKSGLKLPRISLGLWHNFGSVDNYENMRNMCHTAFDLGITHFDLANNYGPEYGSAEENFGRIIKQDFAAYRDELIISTKAGFDMWDGPYGRGGSRKYLLASLDASLKRLGLPYVDIFYHHCMDKNTPIEESMTALDTAVKSGRALYAGISNYDGESMKIAAEVLSDLHCPFVINQNRYNMIDRTVERNGLLDAAREKGMGVICFSPLEQGILSNRYLGGVPSGSRATKNRFLHESFITSERIALLNKLNDVAKGRGQTLAQMALAWVLKDERITSVLVGASNPAQIAENVGLLASVPFTTEQLSLIDSLTEQYRAIK